MRKNAGLKSKKEMKAMLDTGVTLYYKCNKIYFLENIIYSGESPYRVYLSKPECTVGLADYWNNFAEMEIEIRWEDELKNRNILCWVSDEHILPSSKDTMMLVVEYIDDRVYSYLGRRINYKYATPLTEEEVKQISL